MSRGTPGKDLQIARLSVAERRARFVMIDPREIRMAPSRSNTDGRVDFRGGALCIPKGAPARPPVRAGAQRRRATRFRCHHLQAVTQRAEGGLSSLRPVDRRSRLRGNETEPCSTPAMSSSSRRHHARPGRRHGHHNLEVGGQQAQRLSGQRRSCDATNGGGSPSGRPCRGAKAPGQVGARGRAGLRAIRLLGCANSPFRRWTSACW